MRIVAQKDKSTADYPNTQPRSLLLWEIDLGILVAFSFVCFSNLGGLDAIDTFHRANHCLPIPPADMLI